MYAVTRSQEGAPAETQRQEDEQVPADDAVPLVVGEPAGTLDEVSHPEPVADEKQDEHRAQPVEELRDRAPSGGTVTQKGAGGFHV